jgi:hypothetical protein
MALPFGIEGAGLECSVAVVAAKESPGNLYMSTYYSQISLTSLAPSTIWLSLNFSFSNYHLFKLVTLEALLQF